MKELVVILALSLSSLNVFNQAIDSTKTEFWLLNNNNSSKIQNNKKPAPANDNCSSATILTVGAAQVCMNTDQAGVQGGELVCRGLAGGAAYETVWYKFQATSTETTISLNRTGGAVSCGTDLLVFGAWGSSAAASAACMPGNGNLLNGCVQLIDRYDPGYSRSYTTVTGQWYLICISNHSCGGGLDRDYQGCIRLFDTPANNVPTGADGIDQCGVTYNGTNIGYSPSNDLPGNENLDNNAGTTCPTCTAGDDVPYVVNNDSWFTFCATAAGTWTIDFTGITNCYFGNGLQMSIFKGTPGNLTFLQHAPSPSAPGSSWTSANIVLAAGECVYMVVDGFAGDQCDYSYTLNNVAGGCNLLPLPVALTEFTAKVMGNRLVELFWNTSAEFNNDFFTVERSKDGNIFETVEIVSGSGNSNVSVNYTAKDFTPYKGASYYRLKQTDYDDNHAYSNVIAVEVETDFKDLAVYPNPLTGNGHLAFSSNFSGATNIKVVDISGREVINQVINVSQGSNSILLETNSLSRGMYFLTIDNYNEMNTIKFIKD